MDSIFVFEIDRIDQPSLKLRRGKRDLFKFLYSRIPDILFILSDRIRHNNMGLDIDTLFHRLVADALQK